MTPNFRSGSVSRTLLWTALILGLLAIGLCATPLHQALADSDDQVESPSEGEFLLRGQWMVDVDPAEADEPGTLKLTLKASDGRSSQNWRTSAIEPGTLEGLDPALLKGGSHDVTFRVVREAGTFVCRGVLEDGHGAGAYRLELNPAFATELERRKIGRVTPGQQARLAFANAGVALVDELAKQGYDTPDVDQLVRLANHGVSLEYVRGMGAIGYRLGTLDELRKARDHGVTPAYVAALRKAGYENLAFETVRRARDHGVDARYLEGMAKAGYARLPLEELIRARDHGVDGRFATAMREAGFRDVTLAELIRARDHGVDARYAKRVQGEHENSLSLQEVVRLKDRGY